MQSRKRVDWLQIVRLLKYGLRISCTAQLKAVQNNIFATGNCNTSNSAHILTHHWLCTGFLLENCIPGFSRVLISEGPYDYLLFLAVSAIVIVEKLGLQTSSSHPIQWPWQRRLYVCMDIDHYLRKACDFFYIPFAFKFTSLLLFWFWEELKKMVLGSCKLW